MTHTGAVSTDVPRRLREHQRAACDDVVDAFRNDERVQLIMACGTGKTLVGQRVAEAIDARRVLVLVPSLSLLKQTWESWQNDAVTPLSAIAVCSDDSVQPDETVHVADLEALGVRVTTTSDEIASLLIAGVDVVFATYQSSPRIAEAQAAGAPAFDLAICDEAHRLAGRAAPGFATILTERISVARRLFMTATPRMFRAVGDSLEPGASMDNLDLFGPVAHKLTFGQAIDLGLLVDYRVVVVGVDHADVTTASDLNAHLRIGDVEVPANIFGAQLGLVRAIERFGLGSVVSFHTTIARARSFADTFAVAAGTATTPGARAAAAALVTGQMSAKQRSAVLARFDAATPAAPQIVANARCLTEGVDVPALDAVAFCDPRNSQVDITQAIGRAMRTAPGKTIGTIVVPVVLGDGVDPDEVLDSAPWRAVAGVLSALRAHDDRIGAELARSYTRLMEGEAPTGSEGERLVLDLPPTWQADIERSVRVHIVHRGAERWGYMADLLDRYARREGNTYPGQRLENGEAIGSWANIQRTLYRNGGVSPERRARLETIPHWTWDSRPREDRFFSGFARLEAFVAREGHARIPHGHREGGFGLWNWARDMRRLHELGELDADLVDYLTGLNGWEWGNLRDNKWQENIAALRAAAKSGHAVAAGVTRWAVYVRRRRAEGRLSEAQQAELESIPGWSWDTVKSQQWRTRREELRRWLETNDLADLDRTAGNLYHWVGTQRKMFKAGTLSEDQIAALEALPGWRWQGTFIWASGIRQLKAFIEREGHSHVPENHIEGDFALGTFVRAARSRYHSGQLSAHQTDELESINGFVWRVTDARWAVTLDRLRAYAEREGSVLYMPNSYEDSDGYNLGAAVNNQLSRYKAGRIESHKAAALELIPGWAWDRTQARWENAFAFLAEFAAAGGDPAHPPVALRVPAGGPSLYEWVRTQRDHHAQDRIEPQRAQRLAALPGWRW